MVMCPWMPQILYLFSHLCKVGKKYYCPQVFLHLVEVARILWENKDLGLRILTAKRCNTEWITQTYRDWCKYIFWKCELFARPGFTGRADFLCVLRGDVGWWQLPTFRSGLCPEQLWSFCWVTFCSDSFCLSLTPKLLRDGERLTGQALSMPVFPQPMVYRVLRGRAGPSNALVD